MIEMFQLFLRDFLILFIHFQVGKRTKESIVPCFADYNLNLTYRQTSKRFSRVFSSIWLVMFETIILRACVCIGGGGGVYYNT